MFNKLTFPSFTTPSRTPAVDAETVFSPDQSHHQHHYHQQSSSESHETSSSSKLFSSFSNHFSLTRSTKSSITSPPPPLPTNSSQHEHSTVIATSTSTSTQQYYHAKSNHFLERVLNQQPQQEQQLEMSPSSASHTPENSPAGTVTSISSTSTTTTSSHLLLQPSPMTRSLLPSQSLSPSTPAWQYYARTGAHELLHIWKQNSPDQSTANKHGQKKVKKINKYRNSSKNNSIGMDSSSLLKKQTASSTLTSSYLNTMRVRKRDVNQGINTEILRIETNTRNSTSTHSSGASSTPYQKDMTGIEEEDYFLNYSNDFFICPEGINRIPFISFPSPKKSGASSCHDPSEQLQHWRRSAAKRSSLYQHSLVFLSPISTKASKYHHHPDVSLYPSESSTSIHFPTESMNTPANSPSYIMDSSKQQSMLVSSPTFRDTDIMMAVDGIIMLPHDDCHN
jgi:hypothetical protein